MGDNLENNEEIKVDVLMVTYNQEKYISQAIESVLMQKCSFKYRIIIGEDCSFDNTLNICKYYEDKYPEKILLINNKINIGIAANYKNIFNASKSKYIALLEGDDYWIDPYKLQKQVDILTYDNTIGLVHTGYNVIYEDGTTKKRHILVDHIKLKGNIVENLLYENCIGPLTTCFKSEIIKNYIDFNYFINNKYKTIDYAIWLEISANSKIYYLDEVTGIYRNIKSSISNTVNGKDIIAFYNTAFDVYNKFFTKYPQFLYCKMKVINALYISIINSLFLTENYDYAQMFISKLEVNNLTSLLYKFTFKKEIFLKMYKYYREIMSNIKQKALRII